MTKPHPPSREPDMLRNLTDVAGLCRGADDAEVIDKAITQLGIRPADPRRPSVRREA
jgi:hypothetical protein